MCWLQLHITSNLMYGDSLATAARVRVRTGYGGADNAMRASELQNVTMEQWTISHRQGGKSHNSSHSVSQHKHVIIMMSIFRYSDQLGPDHSDHCPLAAVSAHLSVAGPSLGPLCWLILVLVCAGPLPHSQSFILILPRHQTNNSVLAPRPHKAAHIILLHCNCTEEEDKAQHLE